MQDFNAKARRRKVFPTRPEIKKIEEGGALCRCSKRFRRSENPPKQNRLCYSWQKQSNSNVLRKATLRRLNLHFLHVLHGESFPKSFDCVGRNYCFLLASARMAAAISLLTFASARLCAAAKALKLSSVTGSIAIVRPETA